MRTLGIDYGNTRTGLALSDPAGIIAQPFKIIPTNKDIYIEIIKIIKMYEIDDIVIGAPLNRKSSDTNEQMKIVESFAHELKKTVKNNIIFIDERYSSKIIHKTFQGDKKKPQHIDDMSAALILQSYLDTQ